MISYRQNYVALRHVPAPIAKKPIPNAIRRERIHGGPGTAVPCPDLLASIERALQRHGIGASRFGRDAAHDPQLVFRLRSKVTATPEMIAKLTSFIAGLDEKEVRRA